MPPRRIDVNLYRGALRRIGYAKDRSSFPFISGDTYAKLCDSIFHDLRDLTHLTQKTITQKIFLPAYLKDSFIANLRGLKADFRQHQLIIHHYDNIPTLDAFEYLSNRFVRRFFGQLVRRSGDMHPHSYWN